METGNAKRRRLQGAVGKGSLNARAERVERKPDPVPWTRRKVPGVLRVQETLGRGTLRTEPDSGRGFCSAAFLSWHAGKMGECLLRGGPGSYWRTDVLYFGDPVTG